MLSALDPGIRMNHVILHLLTDLVLVIENVAGPLVHALENQDKVRKQMENHMIHPDAWIQCAQHVRDNLNKHL